MKTNCQHETRLKLCGACSKELQAEIWLMLKQHNTRFVSRPVTNGKGNKFTFCDKCGSADIKREFSIAERS